MGLNPFVYPVAAADFLDDVGISGNVYNNPEVGGYLIWRGHKVFIDGRWEVYGLDFCKLAAQEMPITPLMAYNVFTTMDTTYFTGYPTIDDPYTDPVPNWGNTKYMFVKIKPKA